MGDGGYKIDNPEGIYFVSFAVVDWVDVFTRKEYREIVIQSLEYCQEQKGLELYSWCLMTNHVHLIFSAAECNPSELLRDFKKYTSKSILKAIQENDKESRRDWMLEIFERAGRANSRNSKYQFWRQDNQPKECFGERFIDQKLDYIHNNPVEAGIVEKSEEYIYSSARDYYFGKPCGLLKIKYL